MQAQAAALSYCPPEFRGWLLDRLLTVSGPRFPRILLTAAMRECREWAADLPARYHKAMCLACWEHMAEVDQRAFLVMSRGRAMTDDFAFMSAVPGAPAPPDGIDLSQDGLALAMGAQWWDENARYMDQWNRWLFWSGTHWQRDDKRPHMTITRNYLRQCADQLTAWAERRALILDPKEGDKLKAWAKAKAEYLRDKRTIADIESLARSNEASAAEGKEFDPDLMLIGTPGGTVDLRTGDLRPARHGDMITRQTAVAPAEKGAEAPRWNAFLHEVFDSDMPTIDFMQRAAGYALTGRVNEHKMLFLYGTGRNGKSVFLDTLFWLWGDYARRASSDTFLNKQGGSHPTDIAGLHGARLVIGSELPRGKSWDESVIKDLTGGDVMTARFMHRDFFDFIPQLTLMIAGNTQPSFRGVDEAIRARVVMVPFAVTIPPEKRDTELLDKLKAEGPAILRWCIEGVDMWRRRGLDVPEKIKVASAEYFDSEDICGQFIADEIDVVPAKFTSNADLHNRFTQWAEAQGLATWTQTTLTKALCEKGFTSTKSNGKRGFRGVGLVT